MRQAPAPGAWLAVRSDDGRTAVSFRFTRERLSMTVSATSRRESQPISPAMIEIAGGVGAPARARQWVLSSLAREPNRAPAADVELIVSELVTNSVVHAHADSSKSVRITVAERKDCLRIGVTDSGSETVPHLRDVDHDEPGGVGLRIVDRLCLSWGVVRNGAGRTEVWCDLPLSQ